MILAVVPVFLPVLVFEGLFDTLSLGCNEFISDVEEYVESSYLIQCLFNQD